MPTTSRGYRYPAPSNAPNIPQDMANLAADVNTDLTTLTTTASSTVALGSGFTASGRNTLLRRAGWAMLSLTFQRPGSAMTAQIGVSIGTVPAGYRPSVTIDGLGATLAGGTATSAIETNGNIVVRPAASVTAGTSVVIYATWPIGG